MIAYPSLLHATPTLNDASTLEETIDCLMAHLLLELNGSYTVREVFAILVRTTGREDRTWQVKSRGK